MKMENETKDGVILEMKGKTFCKKTIFPKDTDFTKMSWYVDERSHMRSMLLKNDEVELYTDIKPHYMRDEKKYTRKLF